MSAALNPRGPSTGKRQGWSSGHSLFSASAFVQGLPCCRPVGWGKAPCHLAAHPPTPGPMAPAGAPTCTAAASSAGPPCSGSSCRDQQVHRTQCVTHPGLRGAASSQGPRGAPALSGLRVRAGGLASTGPGVRTWHAAPATGPGRAGVTPGRVRESLQGADLLGAKGPTYYSPDVRSGSATVTAFHPGPQTWRPGPAT